MMLTFEVNVGEYGKITSKELVSNGSNVSVTNENREEFVQLYLDWLLNSSIDERFRAFYLGKLVNMRSNCTMRTNLPKNIRPTDI